MGLKNNILRMAEKKIMENISLVYFINKTYFIVWNLWKKKHFIKS